MRFIAAQKQQKDLVVVEASHDTLLVEHTTLPKPRSWLGVGKPRPHSLRKYVYLYTHLRDIT